MSASFSAVGVGGFTTSEEQILNPSEFNPYTPIDYEEGSTRSLTIDIYPQSEQSGKHGVPFHFSLPPDPVRYTNLRKIRLAGELRVWNKTKGAVPAAGEDWSVINNYQQSLISRVSCKINDQEITDPASKTYPYRTYIETLLNYTQNFKETKLTTSGWCEDAAHKVTITDAGEMEDLNSVKVNVDGVDNKHYSQSLVNRREGIADGAWKEFHLLLHHDVITSIRQLPPGYRVEFSMDRTSDEFIFLQPTSNTDNYTMELRRVHLQMERTEVVPRLLKDYLSGVGRQIAHLPYTRNFIRCYPVAKGHTDLSCHNLIHTDTFPTQVLAAMVDQTAYDGNRHLNPYHFQYIPLLQASLVVNSVHEPATPLNTTVGENKKLSVFHYFSETTGGSQRDSVCNTIDYKKFYGGFHLIPFDLSPNKDNGAKRQKIGGGTISINLKAEKPLERNVVVIVYASYGSSIEVKGSEVFTRTF